MPAKKSKKQSMLARVFNLSTTKGKFLVFMLTFAVIGGGFAAYRSFAATDTEMIKTAPELAIPTYRSDDSGNITSIKNSAYRANEASGNKKGLQIVVLANDGDNVAFQKYQLPRASRAVRACAWLKTGSVRNAVNIELHSAQLLTTIKSSSFVLTASSTDYVKKCTPYHGSNGGTFSARVRSKASAPVKVSSISLDWY